MGPTYGEAMKSDVHIPILRARWWKKKVSLMKAMEMVGAAFEISPETARKA